LVFDLNEAEIYVLILCVKVLLDAVKSLFCSPSRSKVNLNNNNNNNNVKKIEKDIGHSTNFEKGQVEKD
jgi:hypothetical protein